MRNIYRIMLYKNPGSGNFVGKILPIMFTIIFGAVLITIGIDTSNTLNVKRKLDFDIQKCIDDCTEFNYSDTKAKEMIKDKVKEDCELVQSAENIDMLTVSITASGTDIEYCVMGTLKLDNGILSKKFDYSFNEKISKKQIN